MSFQKQPVTYSLLINPSSLFSIQPETGEISLTRTIDYESDQHRYLLLVRASENQESLSSAAEVSAAAAQSDWDRVQIEEFYTHTQPIFSELRQSTLFKSYNNYANVLLSNYDA